MVKKRFFAVIIAAMATLAPNTAAWSATSAPEREADVRIEALYHSPQSAPSTPLAERLKWHSAQFLETPYLPGALGEGPNARYDQFPRYRTDAFDCDTYVTTVLALALTHSPEQFRQCLRHIRYTGGKGDYLHRNHFMELDWIGQNQTLGIIRDITDTLRGADGKPVTVIAGTTINKPGWYAHHTLANIRLIPPDPAAQKARLSELQKKGQALPVQDVSTPYIPFTVLFDADGKPVKALFDQIPDGTIVEIVRPDWDLEQLTGTRMNISHLGFAFRVNGTLMFREASSQYHKVVDIPLADYLAEARNSPTIRGINLQAVISGNCRCCDHEAPVS